MTSVSVLRAAREKRGLTLEDVGRYMGVSPSAVSQWERGASSPRDWRKRKLARFLGVDLTDLIAA